MDPVSLISAAAIVCGTYALLAALPLLRRAAAERQAGRRLGVALNLSRRAGPPVLAGLGLVLLGPLAGLRDAGAPGALLIAGGLAWGLHRALADLRHGNDRALALRLAMTAAIAMTLIWQAGLFA